MANNPYAPSASTLESASSAAASRGGDGFLDLSGLSSALSMLLWLSAVVGVMDLLVAFWDLDLVKQGEVSPEVAFLALGKFLLFLITAFVFCRWVYRAHRNLGELGARYLPCTPGWAVGSFFIPVVNIWGPYQAMQALWKASRSPGQWALEDGSYLVGLWWALWILTQLLNNAANQISLRPGMLGTREDADILSMAASLLSVPNCVLLRHIILRIWRSQSDHHDPMLGHAA